MSFSAVRRLAVAACMFVLPLSLSGQVFGDDVAAVEFAMKRDFLNAYAKAGPQDDPIRTLVTWQRLRFGDAVFQDYVDFQTAHGDWPGQDVLRGAGEALIPADFDQQVVIDWFRDAALLAMRPRRARRCAPLGLICL
jgi:soluble lytic murein transglycosylase